MLVPLSCEMSGGERSAYPYGREEQILILLYGRPKVHYLEYPQVGAGPAMQQIKASIQSVLDLGDSIRMAHHGVSAPTRPRTRRRKHRRLCLA